MKVVNKTEKLPMYIFSKFENIKKELMDKGIDVIDFSIGDPDIQTPDFIVDRMIEALRDTNNHYYPPYRGIDEFRKAVAEHYLVNFGVELDYENEVAALIGSKEGIAHLILSITGIGDYLILPDPSYPVYNASALISGCNVYGMNLTEKNDYLPILKNIDTSIIEKAKMLIVNYPNNPTGAVANINFYKDLIAFGKKNNIIIVNDGAYTDICVNGGNPLSLMQTEGAKDVGVEFGTLSKSYNMTGWRLGYIVGNSEIINQLMRIKTNFDSGQFTAIQQAGALALEYGGSTIESMNKLYSERRILIEDSLKGIGLHVYSSKGTFYIWFKNPKGYTSEDVANIFLKEIGVLITPGNAFGNMGEGYCRISLTADNGKISEAAKRISFLKLN